MRLPAFAYFKAHGRCAEIERKECEGVQLCATMRYKRISRHVFYRSTPKKTITNITNPSQIFHILPSSPSLPVGTNLNFWSGPKGIVRQVFPGQGLQSWRNQNLHHGFDPKRKDGQVPGPAWRTMDGKNPGLFENGRLDAQFLRHDRYP